jgi:hypothetical protein
VFKGQWIVCDLRHKLSDAVFLIEKGERKGLAKKLLGERLNATSDMTTEISAFDERFQIIARDTDTASRVLTAPLLESILRCDDSLNSRTYISFKDEYVQIAFDSGRDTFDISDSFIEKASLSALRERMKSEGKRIADMLCILDAAMQNEYLFS